MACAESGEEDFALAEPAEVERGLTGGAGFAGTVRGAFLAGIFGSAGIAGAGLVSTSGPAGIAGAGLAGISCLAWVANRRRCPSETSS